MDFLRLKDHEEEFYRDSSIFLFEQYLTQIPSVPEILFTKTFTYFFKFIGDFSVNLRSRKLSKLEQ